MQTQPATQWPDEQLLPNDAHSSHRRQISLTYVLCMIGVFAAAFIPLSHWGSTGLLLCIWLVAVGAMLLHEIFYPAIVLIIFGVICAPAYEGTLSELNQRPPSQPIVSAELLFGVIALGVLGIVGAAFAVWWRESTPVGAKRVFLSLAARQVRKDGLKDNQVSLAHILGFSTVMCISVLPVFYLGFQRGSLLSPFVCLTGVLLMLGKYRLALLSCLLYPFVWPAVF